MSEAPKPAPAAAAAAAAPRAGGVLSLSIKEKAGLFAAYMPFVKGGGIFIPTPKAYSLGDEVFMLLQLLDDPARIAVSGVVVWISPAGGHGNRTQGIGVQFSPNEAGGQARTKIEGLLGGALQSSRTTHTM
ncbi:PilZ domain-containing protein [Chitinimonas sp. BJB300]|uniref:PilZ domain-containing protein n=1 Tax=Chitinimonas sp. BJB300 TaxID=1559339 RepID=UPI000C10C306|nr:PilZ domain-containing protein [Chitinimonas sp. BJB300]PHV11728.1 pilus assembly protein PilZ [Chitinimonas sp. BJB300]TSJ90005.1 pilus assembly protein PilZ [Chitinimonas sp. BJB300]